MPVWVEAIDPDLPADLAEELRAHGTWFHPTRGDPGQWNPRPFVATPVTIGLYRVAGWR